MRDSGALIKATVERRDNLAIGVFLGVRWFTEASRTMTMPKLYAQPRPTAKTEDPFLVPLSATARTRMVSFRLTNEEHKRYNEICLALGIHGFSELIRIAIDSFVQQRSLVLPGPALESRLSEIESCLRNLTSEIKRLGGEQPPSAARTTVLVPPLPATETDS